MEILGYVVLAVIGTYLLSRLASAAVYKSKQDYEERKYGGSSAKQKP